MNAGYYDEAKMWRGLVLRAARQARDRFRSCTAYAANGG
jgi:hypothetical protein